MLRALAFACCLSLLLAQSATAQLGTPPPRIPVALISGKLVPLNQLRFGFPDMCAYLHYHAAAGGQVTALDGTVIPDPAPTSCGYGPVGALPIALVFDLAIPDADHDGIPDAREAELGTNPNSADSDGDGILDGDEDKDGDGLGNAVEIVQHQTNPSVADSNGNGVIDSIDVVLSSTARDFTVIPLLANIYQGSGVDPNHVRDAIELMNRFYRQAKIRFVLVRVTTGVTAGDDGTGGGTAGDGRFNNPDNEGKKVQDAGNQEIAALPGRKGMKLAFAAAGGSWADDPTPGWSRHRNPACVCEQRASRERTAATIAHELGHIFTLDHPQAGTPERTPGNIMTPSNGGRDAFVDSSNPSQGFGNLTLTPGQIAMITSDGIPAQVGVRGTMRSPAAKLLYQSGAAADPAGDQSGGAPGDPLDLARVTLASTEEDEEIHVLVELWGPFPASGAIDAAYGLLFDVDGDTGTGSTQAGLDGVDREVRIHVTRESGSDAPIVSAQLLIPDAFLRTPLVAPVLLPVTVRAGSETVADVHVADLIELRLRKADLALTAPLVPMLVASMAPGTAFLPTVADTLPVEFDQQRYLVDPDLVVTQEFADPGDAVPFSLAALTPSAPFELWLDDDLVASGTLDGSGSFAGSFPVPLDAEDGFHFLTATDGSESFGFSAIMVPEPSSALAGLAAAAALAARVGRSRARGARAPSN